MWLVLLSGCIPLTLDTGGKGSTGVDGDTELSVDTWSGASTRQGEVKIPFHVEKDGTVVEIVAQSNGWMATEYLYDGGGRALLDWEDWAAEPQSLTEAYYLTNGQTILNWPILGSHDYLDAGDYEMWVATTDSQGYYQSDVAVEATILQRVEEAPKQGTLKVAVAYAGGLEGDRDVVAATESAVDHWKTLYEAVGIDLEVAYETIDMDEALPSSSRGDPAYKSFYASLSERKVVVVIGESVGGDLYTYGEAGGIPGALVPTEVSVVAVSWLACAGANGTFNDDELRLMGETMAHEVGHYLGMFHPVESSYNYWDAIGDTDECSSARNCDSILGENLMYPYTICDRTTCQPQPDLTSGQSEVMQRYIGVR